MFKELLKLVEKQLQSDGKSFDYELLIEVTAQKLIESAVNTEEQHVARVILDHDDFTSKNRQRWSVGFRKLHALRETCL